ncbi:MAG: 2Fe-2S iron-sulfur cluster binding domain-containing protein [Acidobacteria bacterium]|nr:2Fe-2S iron-sulfur cluster binding domain-containing protein [Acidobacteriota bacterium]
MPAAEFHTLQVASVEPLTDESVLLTFTVPDNLKSAYAFVAGQHLILRADIDGVDVRRSYSICTSAGSGELQVAVKRLEDGAFSTYVNTQLAAGDTLAVTLPTGDFLLHTDPETARHYLAIAAGSGITPVMSMISTTLESEPASRFTLLFGNRDGRSIMFLEELGALKDRFPSRFSLLHILSREPNAIPLFEGRIDGAKLKDVFSTVVDIGSVNAFYLCGPAGMVDDATEFLTSRGVEETNINTELFFTDRDAITPPQPVADDADGVVVEFELAGRVSTVVVPPDGAPILDYVLSARTDAPFSCRNGACASCRAVVIEGEVVMDHNWALTQDEVDAGQILTCQSHPVLTSLKLSYDI